MFADPAEILQDSRENLDRIGLNGGSFRS